MKISMNLWLQVGIILAALTLSGCVIKPKPPFEITSPENGMLYGNVHIPGHEVTEIELREYGKLYIPPFIVPPRVMIFRNGDFIAENLKPGNYYISRFVSKKLFYTLVKDSKSAYQWVVKIEPGSIKYMGSFEITDVTPGLFVKGDFSIREVRHPSERKVLKHIYEVTEGTGWQARVDHRIKSLR